MRPPPLQRKKGMDELTNCSCNEVVEDSRKTGDQTEERKPHNTAWNMGSSLAKAYANHRAGTRATDRTIPEIVLVPQEPLFCFAIQSLSINYHNAL